MAASATTNNDTRGQGYTSNTPGIPQGPRPEYAAALQAAVALTSTGFVTVESQVVPTPGRWEVEAIPIVSFAGNGNTPANFTTKLTDGATVFANSAMSMMTSGGCAIPTKGVIVETAGPITFTLSIASDNGTQLSTALSLASGGTAASATQIFCRRIDNS